ncbi:MAG: SDR family oxidoreductase [Bacteroidota bacterium]
MKISIIGCGWLGLPLGAALVASGHQVVGSTTRAEKLPDVQAAGIEAHILRLDAEGPQGDLAPLLQAETLIVNVPPGGRKAKTVPPYAQKLRPVWQALPKSPVKHILFVSSTSVLGGEGIITESDVPKPERASAKALLDVEQELAQLPVAQTILRLSGLVGGTRHPGRFLAGRKQLAGGQQAVNLIHRDDVIGIIEAILDQQAWGLTLHAASAVHPTREAYYTAAAKALWLEPPTFDPADQHPGRIIDSSLLRQTLGYRFRYDDPADMLAALDV